MDKKKNDSPQEEGEKMSILESEMLNNRYCPPAESLRQSLKEVKLMREGKKEETSLQDWFAQIKKDKENGRL
ncbi:MAG: hypothetical protein WA125_02145 [Desulfosporosinus sp.]